ncbi:MAG: molybdenum cofactor biosynthesis protein B [Alphaproteobacteria bacterium]|nr:molybdenum cofactor biosynthesis protein B [Alphaproteobacteria bacterium]MDA7988137.1 molybdenum cofactor biosynthesis protein B [Alphaproteobacteria bacterium]MDA8031534.1 molybdenum cofactor biosynthesis protein B [Alphaproteobacteria bacterium]
MDSDRNTPGGEKPLPGGGALDAARAFIALRVAILTVSDTRSPDSDKSGDLLAGRIAGAGHILAARTLVRDDPAQIRAALEDWIRDGAVDVVLTTGGTGVTARDCTPDVVESLLTRRLDGFGEHFRRISSEIIGTSALQSRAVGGVADGTFIFALPGSPSGCRDAWDGVLRWQLDSRVRPCNLAEMLSRL